MRVTTTDAGTRRGAQGREVEAGRCGRRLGERRFTPEEEVGSR